MWGDPGWGPESCPPNPHGPSHPGPGSGCVVGWRRGAGCHDRCAQPASGAGQLTGDKDGRMDGRMDGRAGGLRKSKEAIPSVVCVGSSNSKVPRMWGTATGRGEGDSVTESSFRLPVLGYRPDYSQGWLLMGRGRWHCPGSVGTIFRGAPGRGIPRAALPSSSPRRMRAPASSTNFPGDGDCGGSSWEGRGWGGA